MDLLQTTNILFAALGTTPQIITESLYHLMVLKSVPIDEVHLITTTTGREKAEKLLFDNGRGAFFRFCDDYHFSSTEIVPNYHLIHDSNGRELPDIRTPEDNQAAADCFLQVTRELTLREATRIFATIAGGRKTMSAYLYLVMQLLGRDQDLLYHVLVRPESIESHPQFFYPRPNQPEMEFCDSAGKRFTVPIGDIRIEMAEIPFVKLNRILPEGAMEAVAGFSDLVARTQAELDKAQFEPEITVNLWHKKLDIRTRNGNFEIKLSPAEICFYAFLAQRGEFINSKHSPRPELKELLKIYRNEFGGADVVKNFYDADSLQQIRSRINLKIRRQIADPLIQKFIEIQTDKHYRHPKYTLLLSPERVRIKSSEDYISRS